MKKLILLLALLLLASPAWAARDFNGTSDYISEADSAAFSFDGSGVDTAYSISGWYRLTDLTVPRILVTKYTSGGGVAVEWDLYQNASLLIWNNWTVLGVGYIQNYAPFSSATYKDNWTHIAITYDGSETKEGMKIYINGSLDSGTRSSSAYTGMIDSTNPVRIGTRGGLDYWFKGQMANLKIYNIELTVDEVKMDMLGAVVRPNKVVTNNPLWGVSSPESDESGNAHTGTLTGTARYDHPPSITAEWQ